MCDGLNDFLRDKYWSVVDKLDGFAAQEVDLENQAEYYAYKYYLVTLSDAGFIYRVFMSAITDLHDIDDKVEFEGAQIKAIREVEQYKKSIINFGDLGHPTTDSIDNDIILAKLGKTMKQNKNKPYVIVPSSNPDHLVIFGDILRRCMLDTNALPPSHCIVLLSPDLSEVFMLSSYTSAEWYGFKDYASLNFNRHTPDPKADDYGVDIFGTPTQPNKNIQLKFPATTLSQIDLYDAVKAAKRAFYEYTGVNLASIHGIVSAKNNPFMTLTQSRSTVYYPFVCSDIGVMQRVNDSVRLKTNITLCSNQAYISHPNWTNAVEAGWYKLPLAADLDTFDHKKTKGSGKSVKTLGEGEKYSKNNQLSMFIQTLTRYCVKERCKMELISDNDNIQVDKDQFRVVFPRQ